MPRESNISQLILLYIILFCLPSQRCHMSISFQSVNVVIGNNDTRTTYMTVFIMVFLFCLSVCLICLMTTTRGRRIGSSCTALDVQDKTASATAAKNCKKKKKKKICNSAARTQRTNESHNGCVLKAIRSSQTDIFIASGSMCVVITVI